MIRLRYKKEVLDCQEYNSVRDEYEEYSTTHEYEQDIDADDIARYIVKKYADKDLDDPITQVVRILQENFDKEFIDMVLEQSECKTIKDMVFQGLLYYEDCMRINGKSYETPTVEQLLIYSISEDNLEYVGEAIYDELVEYYKEMD